MNRNFEDDKDALNAPKYIPRTDDLSVRRDGSTLAHRALIVTGVVVAVLLVLFLLWYAVDVLLLAFAGILLAVFLRGLSDKLGERTGLSENWSLAVVILSLVALIGIGGWLIAPSVAEQVDELTETLPRSIQQVEQRISRYGWGRRLLEQVPPVDEMIPRSRDVVSRVTGVFSTTLGVIGNIAIVLFIGIYLAVDPQLYTGGLLRLVPLEKRQRGAEVLNAIGYTLRWWLIGRAFSMLVIGSLTWLGLWLLDVPLALALGVIAALLAFIPYIGPLLAAAPGLLLALTISPMTLLYVGLLYLAIETFESYLVSPLVEQRTVELPPALTITAQVLLGILLGTLGLVIATPLTAAVMVAVKMLYVEDTLGDEIEIKGVNDEDEKNEASENNDGVKASDYQNA